VSGPTPSAGRGTLTPAVLAAAAFTALAALAAVAFVTARGGLELPVAATTAPPVAVASPGPTPEMTPSATAAPSPPVTSPPSAAPSPTVRPTAPPTAPPGPSGPPDPLIALAACPGHPGCFLYTVRRGDSYTAVSDRYGVGLWIMDALNPEVADKRVIVTGQTLFLGHDPMARLALCPDASCHLYVVRAGDTLSTIAGRYGLSVAGIAARNPGLDPAVIVAGQVIRLPLYRVS
jgi:LysM repeat protein